MRFSQKIAASLAFLLSVHPLTNAAGTGDIPPQRLESTTPARLSTSPAAYYWKTSQISGGAELLTLFCHFCRVADVANKDVPLIAILRDTLGDENPENDRLRYIWLLSYGRPTLGKRALSAVPFFYWRVGSSSHSQSRGTTPLMDLSRPSSPIFANVGRNIFQWTLLDPMTTSVRATTRTYRTNETDNERLHLEEAISYLREAPVTAAASPTSQEPTQNEINTVIARLSLRKRLLGGLVNQKRAEQLGQQDVFEQERIRSRNWEMLRQWAEKTGLLFEPINVAANTSEYAILWYPLGQSFQSPSTPLSPIWKLLSVRDPWTDPRLQNWGGLRFDRVLDQDGSLLPNGSQGPTHVQVVPLGVYNLNYPKLPLLLVDFRDKLHLRRREMTQRTVDDVATGILGLSHFADWYFYVGRAAYIFVKNRHGAALDRAERLDCYSQFRVQLALDHELDPTLRSEMQRRVDSLAVNPLEIAPDHEVKIAEAQQQRLEAEAISGKLTARLEKDRRAELAAFGRTSRFQVTQAILHDASFGAYTKRAKADPSNLADLDRNRRIQYNLTFLDSLVDAGTDPTVTNNEIRIQTAVSDLATLIPYIASPSIRNHAISTLERLKRLSANPELQAECVRAVNGIKSGRRVAATVAQVPTEESSSVLLPEMPR